MVAVNVFAHVDYVAVLKEKIASSGRRGYQSELAAAARCQKSQFSQVLGGKMHLNLDHGAALAELWAMTAPETQYWLTLISSARAASAALKRQLAEQLAQMRAQAADLQKRFRAASLEQERRGKLETEYYLSWSWQLLHVLSGLDSHETSASLMQRTGLAAGDVAHCLGGLEELGLVRRDGERWVAAEANLHLQKTSALIAAYHLSHRQQAVERIRRSPTTDDELHFSALLSLDDGTYQRYLERMREVLREFRAAAIAAPADRVCAVGVDVFVV